MSSASSNSLLQALAANDNGSRCVVHISKIANSVETFQQERNRQVLNTQEGCAEPTVAGRRQLRENVTNIRTAALGSSSSKPSTPSILRVATRLPSPLSSKDAMKNCTSGKIISPPFRSQLLSVHILTNRAMNSEESMDTDDPANVKQNVCPECRALTDSSVCNFCGNKIGSEAKRLKTDPDVKTVVTITKCPIGRNSIPCVISTSPRYQPLEITAVNGRGQSLVTKNTSCKKVFKEPPECLTLSSDDETENSNSVKGNLEKVEVADLINQSKNNHQPLKASTNNEPVVTVNNQNSSSQLTNSKCINYSLECRSVRIGSYKCKNVVVDVTKDHFSLSISSFTQDKAMVTLNIMYRDIAQIYAFFGNSMPVFFIKTDSSCSSAIRSRLNMEKPGFYYDPASTDEKVRRIVMLPEKLPDDFKVSFKQYFKERDLVCKNVQRPTLMEVNFKIANEILMKSTSSAEMNRVMNLSKTNLQSNTRQSCIQKKSVSDADSQRLAVYPLPPLPEGISITTSDFKCLEPETCINDAIIDFYIKYLYYEKLSEFDRKRTHVFSSFFYRKLANSRTAKSRQALQRAPHENRNQMKGWTKHVDIFEKDFIIIPINQKNHWFLAIICFPILAGNNDLVSSPLKEKPNKKPCEESPTTEKVETKPQSLVDYDSDDSDASKETIQINSKYCSSNEDEEMKDFDSETERSSVRQHKEPCILLFDSLHPRNWSHVVSNLREYLNTEWKAKRNSSKIFDKDTIKGAYPIVPQQSNYLDCGIYLLQYVESFFEKPIMDFTLPVRGLQEWFLEDVIVKKRKDIQELIMKLSSEQQLQERNCEDEIADDTSLSSNTNTVTQISVIQTVMDKSSDADAENRHSVSPIL